MLHMVICVQPFLNSQLSIFNLSQSCLDGFGFLFVTRLVQQGEHILLVGFHTRLVERINPQQVAADAACFLKEVQQSAETFLVQCGDHDAHVGYATVYVSQLCAEFRHLVHLVHVLSGEEVQTVEVGFVRRNLQRILRLFY